MRPLRCDTVALSYMKFNLRVGAARGAPHTQTKLTIHLNSSPVVPVIKPNKLPVQFSNTIITGVAAAGCAEKFFNQTFYVAFNNTVLCAGMLLLMMKRNLYPSGLVVALRGIQKRYIKEEKIYPNHPRALCAHACSVLEVCVYTNIRIQGHQQWTSMRERDASLMIWVRLQSWAADICSTEPYVDYCSGRMYIPKHAKGQMRAYII